MPYTSFAELRQGLDGYIDEICPYAVDSSQTLLPNLPLELREEIYSNIIPVHIRSINPHENDVGDMLYDCHYNIFHVNHATSLDVGLWYLRTHEFELGNEESCAVFSKFLEWFPGEQGFRRVRHLEVRKCWTKPSMDLILRCENTMTMKLWFYASTFTLLPQNHRRLYAARDLMTAQEAAHHYSLGRLFCMKHLERIELKWFRPWMDEQDYEHGVWVAWREEHRRGEGEFLGRMEELKNWLVGGFAVAGRKVLVELAPV